MQACYAESCCDMQKVLLYLFLGYTLGVLSVSLKLNEGNNRLGPGLSFPPSYMIWLMSSTSIHGTRVVTTGKGDNGTSVTYTQVTVRDLCSQLAPSLCGMYS